MKRQPFYAVRIVIRHAEGSTSTRDYVRGDMHIGRSAFDSFALGDMIRTCTDTGGEPFTWEIHQVDFATVAENRRYHTTH
jgi:hypothetical protein